MNWAEGKVKGQLWNFKKQEGWLWAL